MLSRLRQRINESPREFWILVGGTLVNATGNALVFPFFTLYVRQRFGIPMTTVGLVLSAMKKESAGASITCGAR